MWLSADFDNDGLNSVSQYLHHLGINPPTPLNTTSFSGEKIQGNTSLQWAWRCMKNEDAKSSQTEAL